MINLDFENLKIEQNRSLNRIAKEIRPESNKALEVVYRTRGIELSVCLASLRVETRT